MLTNFQINIETKKTSFIFKTAYSYRSFDCFFARVLSTSFQREYISSLYNSKLIWRLIAIYCSNFLLTAINFCRRPICLHFGDSSYLFVGWGSNFPAALELPIDILRTCKGGWFSPFDCCKSYRLYSAL